jgi:hypothetical protein
MSSLYLGKNVDPANYGLTDSVFQLAPERLVQHAVCVGMTGSGKTGLCVSLLEELAIAGVPVIVLDPKGDMANLALAFTDHRAVDFEPWVDASEAQRTGTTVAALAEKTAARWKKGLADWGVDHERVRRFTGGVDVSILTPGSRSGIPVNVLSALRLPDEGTRSDDEALTELVGGTVSALLGLVGVEADPVDDPGHIVLSTILGGAWQAGEDLDIEALVVRLVDPPFAKVGVFPVDSFMPRKDRMKLAMKLNGIVASPSFATWSEGVALDLDALLAPVDGKTPIRVFYTAHLDDAERMFFFAMLLDRVVAWSRRQPGTSALRALVYFDEVFGYLPPYPQNPPTKKPVLTLMKQARAVGVGTMLVTQNPVDVDYKALSNAATWFVGRLQTAQDRERVLDGLLDAAGRLDKGLVSRWLENLPARTFVVRDAKEDAPRLIQSRWAMSFLRGPLTRTEVERLGQGRRAPAAAPVVTPIRASSSGPTPLEARIPAARPPAEPTFDTDDRPLAAQPPPCPEGFAYRWLDPRVVFSARLSDVFGGYAEPRRPDGQVVWRPAVHARLHFRFDEGRDFLTERDEERLFFPLDGVGLPPASEPEIEPSDFLPGQPSGGRYEALPAFLDEKRELEALSKRIVEEALRGETDTMYRHTPLRLTSTAGEDRARFEARVAKAVQDKIDERVVKLKQQVDQKVARLEDKRRRLEHDRDRLHAESRAQTATEVVSAAETLFGMFFGSRRTSLSSIASKRQQTMRANERLGRTDKELADLEREVYELEGQTQDEIDRIRTEEERNLVGIEEIPVRMEKDDARVDAFGIVWVPVTREV